MDLFSDTNSLSLILSVLNEGETDKIRQAEKLLKPFTKDIRCIGPLIQQIQVQDNFLNVLNEVVLCSFFLLFFFFIEIYVQGNANEASRLQAALLLKKKLAKHYMKLPGDQQASLRAVLLATVTSDPVSSVRTAVAG